MNRKQLVIFIAMIGLPILDIVTSFTAELPLSLGALVRTILMFLLFFYLFRFLITKPRIYLYVYLLAFLSIVLTLLINVVMKSPFFLSDEIQFGIKTAYYVIMLFAALFLFDQEVISKERLLQGMSIAAIIMGVAYWMAIITKTYVPTYAYVKAGYSGWIYSANELSVIVLILLALTIVYFHETENLLSIFAVAFIISMVPMIGTKTAFYGGIIILIGYFFILLLVKQLKKSIPILALTLTGVFLLPVTPVMTNKQIPEAPIENIEKSEEEIKFQRLMSSRNVYYNETKQNYAEASYLRKLFGLGYGGDYKQKPKMIEMDFYELFFSYGVIGTILLLAPLILLITNILNYRLSVSYLLLLLTGGLIAGVAFVAGHVLFAPAVMSYMAILLAVIGLEKRANNRLPTL